MLKHFRRVVFRGRVEIKRRQSDRSAGDFTAIDFAMLIIIVIVGMWAVISSYEMNRPAKPPAQHLVGEAH